MPKRSRRDRPSNSSSNKDNSFQKTRKPKFQKDHYIATPVEAKNNTQRVFLKALKNKQVAVFNAPAGVGKSFLTMSVVCDWLKKGDYDKVYLSRPSVGMGKTLGLLPGDLTMKFTPYLLPLIDVIRQRYGDGFYNSSLNNGTIEMVPLEYIRGRSFSQIVVIDEAQNVTPEEMYTILTRVEDGGKLIIIGDPTQNDLKSENGIEWLSEFVKKNINLKEYIKVVEATSDDIVRGGLCRDVVKAKERGIKE